MAVFQEGTAAKAPVKAGKPRKSKSQLQKEAEAAASNDMDDLQLDEPQPPGGPERSEADVDRTDDPAEKWPAGKKVPKALAMNNKAIRAREKALMEKFELVQSKITNPLDKDNGVVVECCYNSNNMNAQMDKNFDYTHLIKLQSTNPFVLVRQAMLKEGPYAGHVAIIVKQSVPFPFLRLPKKIRARVFRHIVLHPEGAITMALKQGGTKTAYAPSYQSKNRLAILQVSHQVHDEALPLLYGQLFHFPGTQVISSFLLQLGSNRKHLKNIRSDTYNSQSARTVFHLLTEAASFERLSFAHVSSNEQPKTAIRNIYNDAHGWLLGLDPKNPSKGLNVLSFDHSAFHWREKDEEGNVIVKQWGPAEQVEFLKGLKTRLDTAGRKGA
ncbi:hypothetical protein BCR34DRAFT_89586 [Clohesyomyces aquaticus]|uniref:Uncharacterized protein n=1 Tax=Clohesyomyces aquaticus TaxID=1231657 RepID=A0A1Y1YVB5_9PLEO|nr:hypothetical protein BCR34DRAFT_89586 [Clohesyomyces aquaticus]